MRIKATIEITVENAAQIIADHRQHKIIDSDDVEDIMAYEIKQVLEQEHYGIAEYETANVRVISIQQKG